MLELHSISAFNALPPNLQAEVQKALRTKDRLDDFLCTLNKKTGETVKPSHQARWEPCRHCKPDGPGTCRHCAATEHPGWVWVEQGRNDADIHPSQINKCLKLLWYSCNGFVDRLEEFVDPRLRLIFDLGHAWHGTVQGYGKQGAWCDPAHYLPESAIDPDAVGPDGAPVLPVAQRFWIRGSADALITNYICQNVPGLGDVSVRLIHEYKTINASGFAKLTRPKPEHKFQATIYSAVFDAPLVVYLYTNKDNCQTADFPVAFDHTIWSEIAQKVDKVQLYTNNGQEPPWEETSAVKDQRECLECGYRNLCAPPMVKLSPTPLAQWRR